VTLHASYILLTTLYKYLDAEQRGTASINAILALDRHQCCKPTQSREVRECIRVLRVYKFSVFCCVVVWASLCCSSFARQTGLSCNVCHKTLLNLRLSRNFKLKGYTLASLPRNDKVGNSKDLWLTKNIPLSAMILLSNSFISGDQRPARTIPRVFRSLSIFSREARLDFGSWRK